MFLLKYYKIFTPKSNFNNQIRSIKRWVAPTLRELLRRRRKMGPEAILPRSNYIEWNYNSEIYAFGKRLNESFDMTKLQTAFTHRSYIIQEELKLRNVGIEEPTVNVNSNEKLIERGEELISDYVRAYLKISLPNLPEDGLNAIYKYLTCEETLAHISSKLGTGDLARCADFPASKEILRDTFVAVIGALVESSGEEQARIFIKDFICTQLNQKDLLEVWDITFPLERLKVLCKEKGTQEPEARIIGEVGKNTVLATYHVGVYSNKKLMGTGFGESVQVAVDMAATDALRKFYGIQSNMKPFNLNIEMKKNWNDQKSAYKNI